MPFVLFVVMATSTSEDQPSLAEPQISDQWSGCEEWWWWFCFSSLLRGGRTAGWAPPDVLDNEKSCWNQTSLERINPNQPETFFFFYKTLFLHLLSWRSSLTLFFFSLEVFEFCSGFRVTAQRSQEDAEEVERERRRRSRDGDRGEDRGPQDNRTDDPQSVLLFIHKIYY